MALPTMRNIQASAKSLAENGIINIAGAGAPTSGTSGTGVRICGKGSLYFDVTNGLVYQNTGTTTSPTWTLLAVANIASGTLTRDMLTTALQGSAAGLGFISAARATFDPSANSGERTVAAHGLGVTIPDDAVVMGGFVDVKTTFTSAADSATIAIHVQSANDIVSAIAISDGSNPWDAGLKAIVPKINTPESTGIKLTAAREITATVAVQALTAGKFSINLFYVVGF